MIGNIQNFLGKARRKKEIEKELDKTRKAAEKELNDAVSELQKIYDEKKKEWIDMIYKESTKHFLEE